MLNEMMIKLAVLSQALQTRFEQEEGQGLVEYALIIALVSILLVSALGLMKGGIEGVFTTITAALNAAK